QVFIRIHIIDGPEELHLSQFISRRPITADPNADKSCTAAMSLSLIDGVQDALADSIQVPPCSAKPFKLRRQAVLDVLVLAAAALEDQPNFNLILLPLFEVDDGRAFSQIISGIRTGQGINGVRAQL